MNMANRTPGGVALGRQMTVEFYDCSAAILADDAIAVLEDVDVGEYYDYDRN